MSIEPYPCNRGQSMPVGWHHFAGPPPAVCIYCGKQSGFAITTNEPHDYFGPYGVGRGGEPDA